MGADLIAYIVVGPQEFKITAEMIIQIKESSLFMQNTLKKYCAEEPLTDKETAFTQDYFEKFGDIDVEDISEDLDRLSDTNRLQVAAEFVAGWPYLGRDTACRSFGDKVIIAAGEMSWGDTPDGAGYQMIDDIYQLNLEDILGLE